MARELSNFFTRTISGILFVLIVAGSVLLSHYYVFPVVFVLISSLAISEFHELTNHNPDIFIHKWIAISGNVILFISSYLFAAKVITFPVFSIYGLFIVVVFVVGLFSHQKNQVNNWAYFLMGQIYVALPFSLLNFILYIAGLQPIILLAVFVTIWINDTGAYIFGISFGKHRLYERISPKKSWEGFFGGAIVALGSGYIFSLMIPQISLLNWMVFSEIIVIFGTLGDLTESLIKRTVNVKDSGNIIPGHGGLLDRFDSMLMAAPIIYLYLSLIFQ